MVPGVASVVFGEGWGDWPADDITATYSDGILEVRIPAPEEVETPTARIPVTRG